MSVAVCSYPGCGGRVDFGYCDTCGRRERGPSRAEPAAPVRDWDSLLGLSGPTPPPPEPAPETGGSLPVSGAGSMEAGTAGGNGHDRPSDPSGRSSDSFGRRPDPFGRSSDGLGLRPSDPSGGPSGSLGIRPSDASGVPSGSRGLLRPSDSFGRSSDSFGRRPSDARGRSSSDSFGRPSHDSFGRLSGDSLGRRGTPPPGMAPAPGSALVAPPDGAPCPVEGCGGHLDAGYCDTCGRAPVVAVPAARSGTLDAVAAGRPAMPLLKPVSVLTRRGAAEARARLAGDSGPVGSRRTGGTRLGLGLVDVPAVPTGDPAEAIMPVAEVPEEKRYCSQCGQPVGRSRQERPGRTEGFCPGCRTQFSFTPKLAAGDMVAGQYEVLGALAHGGLGWVYLARDRAVSDRWVVLKGLLDAASDAAATAAVAERQFLAAIDHPNIVQIYNFVTHEDAGYIVMEYVGGKSLKTILKERRSANAGRIDPLPVDRAIAYALAILPALGYFHAQGLVYCDMKPDNVVLFGDTLKMIDLGGVRRIDDEESAIYGTVGYQAPEVAEHGPSVSSDLYTVGRLLAVLTLDFRGYQSTFVHSLPPPSDQPLLARHESLHRFLLKATAADPADRFTSADDMGEQLLGILREHAATHGGQPQPAVSRMFGPDGLVGTDLPDDVPADWRLLPQPKAHPDDPAAGFLLGLADGEPVAVAAMLSAALRDDSVPATPETVLRLARAQLESGDPAAARASLDRLDGGGTTGMVGDWRVWWHRGLVALDAGDPAAAIGWFDPVYTELPGEVPPKLALALAHELAGDLARSADLYDVVSRTDPSYVSGAFGLARVRLAAGSRDGAVDALARVPAASSAHVTARITALRALASATDGPGGHPTPEQLEQASAILAQLRLDPRRHAEMACELFAAGLTALAAGGSAAGRGEVLGRPLAETPLREGLEASYRQLARHAGTAGERNDLIDRANRARPRTLL